MARLGEKPLDDIVQGGILRNGTASQQVDYLGILCRKQCLEGGLGRRTRGRKFPLQVPEQQRIQLPHSPPAAPAQAGKAGGVQPAPGR